MEASSALRAPAETSGYRFRYHGDGTDLFVLILKNALLTLVTLGIYAAWAKAQRRRYIWSNVAFHGQRLEFTGTGLELFKGYLKVLAAYLLIFAAPAVVLALLGASPRVRVAAQAAGGLVLLILMPYAIYRSRAYLLSRTRWRGIRLGMVGSAGPYMRTFLLGSLLTVLTLGIYSPWVACQLRAITTNNMRFGSQPFRYDGNGRELFPIWIKGVLLTLVTLGIYGFWLQAALTRYHLAHTHFDGSHVRFGVTGGHLLKLTLVQVLGTTLTLGIAFPWIVTWAVREVLDRIDLVGTIDFDRIAQRAGQESATSDALADVLDVGLGI
jgi:uncharacterized membrane protein YjgN (DUF898 family)